VRGQSLPPEVGEHARQRNRERGLWKNLRPGYQGEWWTAEQLALLGTAPDVEIAQRIGRTARAVRIMRCRRGIATALDRRRKG
jgi:hypothetical protein